MESDARHLRLFAQTPKFVNLSDKVRQAFELGVQLFTSARFRRDLLDLMKAHKEGRGELGNPHAAAERDPNFIDVRKLLKTMTVEELAETADQYFRDLAVGNDAYFAKPLWSVEETPAHLITFSHVLTGLKPMPGMKILDFGAGTCWTSRFFTQMGFDVTACDVSKTALEIGRELYKRLPVMGSHIEPKFLHFDGHQFNLPDESVDRIACFDAFHHVPNPEQVIREMGRVLKKGGIAGFSEPGPHHSKGPLSQLEMRNFNVLENDVIIEDIWEWAQKAGFTAIDLNIYDFNNFRIPLHEFQEFLAGGSAISRKYLETLRGFMNGFRMFFLYKGEPESPDSRSRLSLNGTIQVDLQAASAPLGSEFFGRASIINSGGSVWLPANAGVGAVNLGVHLRSSSGELLNLDFARITVSECRPVRPGETLHIDFKIPAPTTTGLFTLEFDLVSEHVTWFEGVGARPIYIPIEVT